MPDTVSDTDRIHWTDEATARSARWHSENAAPPLRRVVVADDRTKADTAYRLACEGTGLLWRGDFHNARQLLQAMGRRVDRKAPRGGDNLADAFRAHRRARRHRARVLGRLMVLLDAGHRLDLRRAPDVRQACAEAYGPPVEPTAVSLTELLGVVGAHEWRRRGVEIPALGARIHPHYGVFAPVRGEYVDLVARARLPEPRHASGGTAPRTAFDLGTGTGVLAAVLARRGIERIAATDISPRALACAQDNVHRLGYADRIDIAGPSLFPPGRAHLVVCNPPWLPGSPTSTVEQGVYDPDSGMLRSFLTGLADRLEPGGEGWLLLSDLAELLGLRRPDELPDLIHSAGLRILDSTHTTPTHPKARDSKDPLHQARAQETTTLWRLSPA
ncbi:methyltransferase [Yinghuangia sp. YIM S09857]|uniref:methyltransferase n=1 Tax=Yinghuangia sp. YIM S09857 TaxID=3436929 RepID=UPI003F52BA08